MELTNADARKYKMAPRVEFERVGSRWGASERGAAPRFGAQRAHNDAGAQHGIAITDEATASVNTCCNASEKRRMDSIDALINIVRRVRK